MPTGLTRTLGAKIPVALHEKIAAAAKAEGRSVNNWVIWHFTQYFEGKSEK
jgi:predicted HicB family RNase H-like nuclease